MNKNVNIVVPKTTGSKFCSWIALTLMDTKLPGPNPLEKPLSYYCSKNNLEATLDISTFISLYSSLFLIKASGKDFKNKIH